MTYIDLPDRKVYRQFESNIIRLPAQTCKQVTNKWLTSCTRAAIMRKGKGTITMMNREIRCL